MENRYYDLFDGGEANPEMAQRSMQRILLNHPGRAHSVVKERSNKEVPRELPAVHASPRRNGSGGGGASEDEKRNGRVH